jgi:hypothetical protein
MTQILIPIHIISGVIALASPASALSFKKGENRHFLSGNVGNFHYSYLDEENY